MDHITHYVMPMYTSDQTTYFRQMYEWHMKMNPYHEQLRTYHLERAKHFQRFVKNGNEKTKDQRLILLLKAELLTWSDFVDWNRTR